MSEKHSKSETALKHYLDYQMDTEKVLRSLAKKGYLGMKKKKGTNYWAILEPTIKALEAHGYRIPRGGQVKLGK